MLRAVLRALFVVGLALVALSGPARAGKDDYLETTSYEAVDQDVQEIKTWHEFQSGSNVRRALAIEYGVSDRWALAVRCHHADLPPEILTRNAPDGIVASYRLALPGQFVVDPAVALEMTPGQDGAPDVVGARLIMMRDVGDVNFTANIAWGGTAEAMVGVNARVAKGIKLGVEALARPGERWVIPGMYLEPNVDTHVRLGYAMPLMADPEAGSPEARLVVEVKF